MTTTMFEPVTVTSQTRSVPRDSPYLDAVKNLPVTDPALKERPGGALLIELSGNLKAVGPTKRDGVELAASERRQEDTAVFNARTDLDAAGNALGVTVRKQIAYGTMSRKKEFVPDTPESDVNPTHARFFVYVIPRQTRTRNTSETVDTANVNGDDD